MKRELSSLPDAPAPTHMVVVGSDGSPRRVPWALAAAAAPTEDAGLLAILREAMPEAMARYDAIKGNGNG